MHINKLKIPLDIVIDGANLIILSVDAFYDYSNGKKTDKMIGYRYTVGNDKTFDKFSVKIPSTTPAITQEQIDSSKTHVFVKFDNAIARPYRTQSGDYELSITASAISVVKN